MATRDPDKIASANRRYYENGGHEKVREGKRRAVARNREYVNQAKDAPCVDCDKRYPYYVMDFDHVADDKDANVGWLASQGVSIARLQAEMDKCEVVCSNCHRERTHRRSIAGL